MLHIVLDQLERVIYEYQRPVIRIAAHLIYCRVAEYCDWVGILEGRNQGKGGVLNVRQEGQLHISNEILDVCCKSKDTIIARTEV